MATKKSGETKPKVEEKPKETAKEAKTEQKQLYTYIGPSIGGFLMQNTTLKGTKTDIKNNFKDLFEKHSKLEHLFIPVEKLGETKLEGILEKYYNQTIKELKK